MTRNKIHENI